MGARNLLLEQFDGDLFTPFIEDFPTDLIKPGIVLGSYVGEEVGGFLPGVSPRIHVPIADEEPSIPDPEEDVTPRGDDCEVFHPQSMSGYHLFETGAMALESIA